MDDIFVEVHTPNFEWTQKLAMFDLDDTLIHTSSGEKFAKDDNDWMFGKNVLRTLQCLSDDGYCIIIITNQGKYNSTLFLSKLAKIFDGMSIPAMVYILHKYNKYRKPSPAIYYDVICKETTITHEFYCGDAAGRIAKKSKGIKADHSDCDIKFAANCRVKFYLPEQLFQHAQITLPPIKYNFDFKLPQHQNTFDIDTIPYHSNANVMIILVGLPASGKSSIAKYISKKFGFTIINRDTMKTHTMKLFENAINAKQNVVIDNTNVSTSDRQKFIQIAKGYYVICLEMTTDLHHAFHNNCYRAYVAGGDFIKKKIYHFMNARYVRPCISEGINEYHMINPTEYITQDHIIQYFYYFET